MTSAALAVLLAASPAFAADEFMKNMRKAETRREPEERVEYFDRAIKAWNPANHPQALLANCHLRRGEALVELWEFDRAVPDLTKALELDGGAARAYALRGRARLKLGNKEKAAEDFKEYATQKPEELQAWLDLGDTQLGLARHEAALESFGKAEALDASDPRGALGSARARIGQKDWKSALTKLDEAAKAKSPPPDVFLERALVKVALGRHAASVLDYSEALPMLERRLDAKRRARAPAQALDEEQALLAKTFYGRGRVQEFLIRMDDARADYQQACDLFYQEACARMNAMKDAEPTGRALPELAPPAEEHYAPEPKPKPVKVRRSRFDDDAGDRIYAN